MPYRCQIGFPSCPSHACLEKTNTYRNSLFWIIFFLPPSPSLFIPSLRSLTQLQLMLQLLWYKELFFGLMVTASLWPRKSRRQNRKKAAAKVSLPLTLTRTHTHPLTHSEPHTHSHAPAHCACSRFEDRKERTRMKQQNPFSDDDLVESSVDVDVNNLEAKRSTRTKKVRWRGRNKTNRQKEETIRKLQQKNGATDN